MPFLLLGHSLGGILAWKIGCIRMRHTQSAPIVLAFDSWVVENDKLEEQEVSKYLQVNRYILKILFFSPNFPLSKTTTN